MPWDAIVKLVGVLASVVLAFVGWRKWGKWREQTKQVKREAAAHEAAFDAGEEFDAGGGLSGGVARARKLREAKTD